MSKIAEWIVEHDIDVIGFQEAMQSWAREQLLRALNEERDAGQRRYEGVYFDCKIGSGLFIVSNRPITESYFRPYEDQGPICDSGLDWWGGKGIAMARIDMGAGSRLNFINTHVMSFYPTGVDELLPTRFRQMTQLAGFINQVAETGGSTVVVGDFNCGEEDEEWQLLTRASNLVPLFEKEYRTDIDFIFGVRHATSLEWTPIQTKALHRRHRARDGRRYVLSDHDGHFARVTVTPSP